LQGKSLPPHKIKKNINKDGRREKEKSGSGKADAERSVEHCRFAYKGKCGAMSRLSRAQESREGTSHTRRKVGTPCAIEQWVAVRTEESEGHTDHTGTGDFLRDIAGTSGQATKDEKAK